MKLAVISSGHIPSMWAHSVNVMKHAAAFHQLGHQVEVFTVERCLEKKLRLELDDVCDWYGVPSVPIRYFPEFGAGYWKDTFLGARVFRVGELAGLIGPYPSKDPEYEIAKQCAEHSFDLAYCRTFRAARYCLDFGLPIILETHNPAPDTNRYLRDFSSLFRQEKFKAIVTIHQKIADRLEAMGVPLQKLLVLEDAVSLEQFDAIADSKQMIRERLNLADQSMRLVMYVGSLKAGKGIGKILETANSLSDDSRVRFVVVGGSAREVAYWQRQSKRLGCNNITFVGFVPNRDISQYMVAADVLLMPHDTSERNPVMDIETTSPIKLFEYMASGNPIVTTKLPTLEKVVTNGSTAMLVPMGGDYAAAIRCLLGDADLSRRLAVAAREVVRAFTYEVRARTILDSIEWPDQAATYP